MTGDQSGGQGGAAPTVDLGIASIGPASEIGRGAAGVVYRAEQPAMNRTVAVKVLPFAALDEAARARFERECRAMGSVSGHAGIVTVYEAGFTPAGQPYILMELMDGGSLEQRLALRGPFQWEEVVEIGVRLAGALEVAHRKGILHRDIKPDNVLVSTYGDAKLADFSIARLAGATKTQTGLVAATPAHAPPEVLRGEDPSVRGDVYSLASTLWALLAGSPAFLRPNETTIFALLRRVEEDPVPDLRPRGVPDPICRVLERALSKDPMQRPATANEFGAELLAARDQARAWHADPARLGGTMLVPPSPGGPAVAPPPGAFGSGHPGMQSAPPHAAGPLPAYPTGPPIPPPGAGSPPGGAPVPPPAGMLPPGPAGPGGPGMGTGGWMPATPAAPGARRQGPSPQLVVAGLAVLAAAVVVTIVLILLFGRSSNNGGGGQAGGSSASGSASDSQSATNTDTGSSGGGGSVDPCLVGSWTASGVSGDVSAAGLTLHLSGGGGEKLTVSADGTYVDDFASAKPIQGDDGAGATITITTTGKATAHISDASGGHVTGTLDDPNDITQTFTAAGITSTSQHPDAAISATYTCRSGGFTTVAPDGTTTTYVGS